LRSVVLRGGSDGCRLRHDDREDESKNSRLQDRTVNESHRLLHAADDTGSDMNRG
jgi:hypothetical protein